MGSCGSFRGRPGRRSGTTSATAGCATRHTRRRASPGAGCSTGGSPTHCESTPRVPAATSSLASRSSPHTSARPAGRQAAVAAYLEAADRAEAVFANAEAIDHLEAALALDPSAAARHPRADRRAPGTARRLPGRDQGARDGGGPRRQSTICRHRSRARPRPSSTGRPRGRREPPRVGARVARAVTGAGYRARAALGRAEPRRAADRRPRRRRRGRAAMRASWLRARRDPHLAGVGERLVGLVAQARGDVLAARSRWSGASLWRSTTPTPRRPSRHRPRSP